MEKDLNVVAAWSSLSLLYNTQARHSRKGVKKLTWVAITLTTLLVPYCDFPFSSDASSFQMPQEFLTVPSWFPSCSFPFICPYLCLLLKRKAYLWCSNYFPTPRKAPHYSHNNRIKIFQQECPTLTTFLFATTLDQKLHYRRPRI